MDPLEAYREGLALARRAGMSWYQAEHAAYEAALAVEPDPAERSDWASALYDTRTAWMRAYERRPTGFAL
ncbi:MAG: hypothetical protein QOI89_2722 [Solirubrobacteraceae bacterium]|jgi:hypothetical protein|nr:hypothetical protein [Solirubrobacteraceae bacterium]